MRSSTSATGWPSTMRAIDFGLDDQDNVLFFEANASMTIHLPAADERWEFRRAPVAENPGTRHVACWWNEPTPTIRGTAKVFDASIRGRTDQFILKVPQASRKR